ncbi:MAG: malate dehydrogenase, partial [Exiguobacterium oxidotolerans]
AIVEMVEAILKDQRRILPAIAYLEGEYGYHDLYFGVPTIIGGNGLEQIIELELTEDEQQSLDRSAETVRSVLTIL